MEIRKAAVIGAGVMGGGIAAQIANAGIPVVLLDRAADGSNRRAIVEGALSSDPEQDAISLVYVTLIMAFSLAVILLAERIGLGKGPEINRI